jgi:hypothetical protein
VFGHTDRSQESGQRREAVAELGFAEREPPPLREARSRLRGIRAGKVAGTTQLKGLLMAKLQDRALDRANDVRPYLERALKDEQVREDVKSAILTAREIYAQLMGGRSQITAAAARVATDEDIQESFRDAIDDLRSAADRIQGKSSHSARNATLLMTGIVLGILFNPVTGPGTRRWLQDKVFGEGEEFEYRQDNAK